MMQLPKKLKNKIIFRLIRKVLLCLFLYAVLIYAFVIRYSFGFYTERIGEILAVFIYTAVVILPFFLSGLFTFLKDSSYEGTVIKLRRARELKPWRGGTVWYSSFIREQCIAVYATVQLDNGDVIERLIRRYDYDDLAQSLCQVGDRVRHVKGARFTQIYGAGKRHDVDCVWCGGYADKRKENCDRCGTPLLHWINVELPKTEDGKEIREALREEEPEVHVPRYTGPDIVDESDVHSTISYAQKPTRTVEEEFKIGEVTPTPEFGTYKRRVDFFDFLSLFGVSVASLAITGYISLLVTKMLENDVDKWIFAVLFTGVLPAGISIYYMRSYPSNHYRKSGRFPAWLMQASLFVLPAELLRLIVSTVPMFMNAFGSLFSPLSHLWWYLYHMLPSERLDELEKGIYIAEDYNAYLTVAIPEMLIRILVFLTAYYVFWRMYEKEREIMFNERNGRK